MLGRQEEKRASVVVRIIGADWLVAVLLCCYFIHFLNEPWYVDVACFSR